MFDKVKFVILVSIKKTLHIFNVLKMHCLFFVHKNYECKNKSPPFTKKKIVKGEKNE